MLVSVAMPLFNKAAEVGRSIESVLAQTFPDFEVVVIDDGSTDGSGEIVSRFADPRIRLIRQPNAGEGPARHRGIIEGRGEFVAFLDPDDEWLPWFLERGLALLQDFPEAVAGGQGVVINALAVPHQRMEGERGLVRDFFKQQRRGPVLSSSSVVGRRKRIIDTVPNVERAPIGADQMLWCPLALEHPVAFDPRVGTIYHTDALNRALSINKGEADLPFVALLEKAMANGLPQHVNPRSVRQYIAFHQLRHARRRIKGGHRRGALQLLLRYRPSPGDRLRWIRYLAKALFS